MVCTISLVMLGLAPTQRKRAPILGSEFKLVFHACQGLRESDPVVVGGVPAGRVVNIDFAPESSWKELNRQGDQRPVVLVTVALEQGFTLSPGTGYKIVSTLRGNHFINILPPPPGEKVSAGSILNEELPNESDDQLMATIRGFKVLGQRTKDMRDQFANPEFRREMKDLASNLRFYSAEFVRVSQGSRKEVIKMQNQLEQQEQSLLGNVHKMDQQATRVASYVQTFVPAFRSQLHSYRKRLDSSQKQLDQAYGVANEYGQKLKQFSQELASGPIGKLDHEKISQKAHELNRYLEDRADIAGDVHTFVSDYWKDDLKALPKKYKAQSQKWKEQAQDFEKRVDSFRWIAPSPPQDAPPEEEDAAQKATP